MGDKKEVLSESETTGHERYDTATANPMPEYPESEDVAVSGADEDITEITGDNELTLLQKKIEQLQSDLAKHIDLSVRAQADADNIRKRSEREIRNSRMYALEDFAASLLGIKDNLERSLLSHNQDQSVVKDFHEGVSLTLKSLVNIFDKFGIKEINPIGESFNPELHQAMSMQESSEHPQNSVIEVMQTGYLLNGRLLRPALVMVAKSLSNKEKSEP